MRKKTKQNDKQTVANEKKKKNKEKEENGTAEALNSDCQCSRLSSTPLSHEGKHSDLCQKYYI